MPDAAAAPPTSLDDVPGWFRSVDQLVFEWILEAQSAAGIRGDLAELGVYEGKSAIHMAKFLRDGESLTVCDLFEDVKVAAGVPDIIRVAYSSLSQDTFERNYLAFHRELPVIVRGRSDTIEDHVEAGSCRFVHIDASHLYDDVRRDIGAVRRLLGPGGVVAFDDYRTEHTLGTAAAVWEAVANDDLHPIAATTDKMYATWSDPAPLQEAITRRLRRRSDLRPAAVPLRDGHVVRIAPRKMTPRPPVVPSRSAPRSSPLVALERVGLGLSDVGYRMVRLARNDDPGASIRRSIRRRVDAVRPVRDRVARGIRPSGWWTR